MIVSKLIEELQKHPGDMDVVVRYVLATGDEVHDVDQVRGELVTVATENEDRQERKVSIII